jgi:hypothetical protein
MQIKLVPGDYLWSSEGTHVCDAQGFAQLVSEATTVEIPDDEAAQNAIKIIKDNRSTRGVDPETGEALPPPPPVAEEPMVDESTLN